MADAADEVRSLRDTTIVLVNALVEQGVLEPGQGRRVDLKGAGRRCGTPPISQAPSPLHLRRTGGRHQMMVEAGAAPGPATAGAPKWGRAAGHPRAVCA